MVFSRFLLITSVLAIALIGASPAAIAQNSSEEHAARIELAHSMANMTLAIVTDTKKKLASDRQDVLQRGFTNVVDIDWIAKFVLGSAWKNASDEQRTRYTELYRRYLTHVYVSTYAENSDRKIRDIKVLAVNDSNVDDSRFVTRTEIQLANDRNIKVDYLAEQREPGHYKIIDVVIEGVSLLSSHRAQFSTIATKRGVDAVIATLEQLVKTA